MTDLARVAPEFVAMAHRIVWASVATVDTRLRPRTRILHPLWEWDAGASSLTGWVATGPTPLKVRHLAVHPHMSVNYWELSHDTCLAECEAQWFFDDETRERVWNQFKDAPAPVGYDPAVIPPWKDGPLSPAFAALKLTPWRLRVMPGTLMTAGKGEILTWAAADAPS